MDFKLILVPRRPDEYLLYGERPLRGLAFVEAASKCLRRNLDLKAKTRHNTLGSIARYEISVPQALAVDSGWFDNKTERYLTCEAGILEKYVFYGASMGTATNRPSYPWYSDEVVLTSYVDELELLSVWRQRGYPDNLTVNLEVDNGMNFPIVDDVEDVEDPNHGDVVLDDLLNGMK